MGEAAQTVNRLANQNNLDPHTILMGAIKTYAFIQDELWAGGEFSVSRDSGVTNNKVVFGFQPPRIPTRPAFFDWLGASAYFPLIAGIIVTTMSVTVSVLIIGKEAGSFATTTILVCWGVTAIMGGSAWLAVRYQRLRQASPG